MRRFFPFLLIYVLLQQGGNTIKSTWSDGQPVDQLLDGKTYQIVDKSSFDAVPDTKPIPLDPVKESERKQAILDAKDKSKKTEDRLDALIKALLP